MSLGEKYKIRRMVLSDGVVPFAEWYGSIPDQVACRVIDARLTRLARGNIGLFRSVGEGVYELKIQYGPGYRIYFAWLERTVLLLLYGGKKNSQQKDIEKAKDLWRLFKNAN